MTTKLIITISALATAGALVISGGAILGVAIAAHSFEFSPNTEVHTEEFDEAFNKIEIDTMVSDIEFRGSTDDKCKVEAVDAEKLYHEVKLEDGTLTIKQFDNYKWYDKLFGYSNKFSVTVYLPLDYYKDVHINTDTGDVTFNKVLSIDDLEIKASTGDIKVIHKLDVGGINVKTSTGNQNYQDVIVHGTSVEFNASTGDISFNGFTADAMNIETDTGKIFFKDTIIAQHLGAKASTGDIKFVNSDADTLDIKTSTGDVTGNLLSDKTFHTHTSTGNVHVPSTTGGECNITTSTGDIFITVGAI